MNQIRIIHYLFLAAAMACLGCGSPPDVKEINTVAVELPGVTVDTPERAATTRELHLSGSVEPLERAELRARIEGYIIALYVDRGDWVKKGQRLALLDIPDTQKDLDAVQADYEYRLAAARRLETAHAESPDMVSELDVEKVQSQANAAKAQLEKAQTLKNMATIRAPFDGVITDRLAELGDLLRPGSKNSSVFEIMSVDTLRIFVEVPESAVAFVQKDLPARVVVPDMPGSGFEGAVARIGWAVDPSTHTMTTEIRVKNPEHRLRAGMYVQVTLMLSSETEALRVPATAIRIDESGRTFVFRVEEGGILQKQIVTTGLDDGVQIEVLSGLRLNEKIVTGSKANLSEGDTVRMLN